jgi:hypothetical protein
MNRLRVGLAILSMLLWVLPSATASAAAPEAHPYTCHGGVIGPGNYSSVTIAGDCSIPAGTVSVRGNLTVESGKSLNAGSPAATVSISGRVLVKKDAIFILGCSPSFPCPGSTNDRVGGGVVADHALAVILHGNTIKGGISMWGGGGGVGCAPNAALTAVLGMGPIPAFSSFENNRIDGGVSVSGYQSCWLGFIRNDSHGSVTFRNNILADPDAVEIATNTIHGNLRCSGNSAALLDVPSGGLPNVVSGRKLGQCSAL